MNEVEVRNEIVIDRSLSEVARYACDPDTATEWYVNIKSVEWQTPRPLAAGSKIAFVAHFLGRRLAYTYEVVELVVDRSLVMRTSSGPFPMETSYAFDPLGPSRTRVVLVNRGKPTGFSKLASPLIALAMRRATQKDLEALKKKLER